MKKPSFTFMEIIIAVTIFMFVALALFAYSRETSRSWSKIVTERNRFSELLALDRSINGLLENIIPFTWPNEDQQSVPFIVANRDSLRCAYIHRLNDEIEGCLRFAEFLLENNNLYIVYSDRPFLNWDEVGERKKTALLAEDVSSIHFRYADWSADNDADWEQRLLWLDEWETEDSERKDAPLAVMLTINWQDGRSESWLRRTMGNSYRERFGKWEPLSDDKR